MINIFMINIKDYLYNSFYHYHGYKNPYNNIWIMGMLMISNGCIRFIWWRKIHQDVFICIMGCRKNIRSINREGAGRWRPRLLRSFINSISCGSSPGVWLLYQKLVLEVGILRWGQMMGGNFMFSWTFVSIFSILKLWGIKS